MDRNTYLVFCGKVMEVMTQNNVPLEVQNQIAQINPWTLGSALPHPSILILQ